MIEVLFLVLIGFGILIFIFWIGFKLYIWGFFIIIDIIFFIRLIIVFGVVGRGVGIVKDWWYILFLLKYFNLIDVFFILMFIIREFI